MILNITWKKMATILLPAMLEMTRSRYFCSKLRARMTTTSLVCTLADLRNKERKVLQVLYYFYYASASSLDTYVSWCRSKVARNSWHGELQETNYNLEVMAMRTLENLTEDHSHIYTLFMEIVEP